MASKSIQILVNEFPAWSDSAAWGVAPTTVHRLGRAFCAGDAAGCKPAGHTGPKAYVPRVVILSREDGEGPLIARVRSSRLRVSSSFARFGMARGRQVQARCEGEWELTNETMITQKSLCDSILWERSFTSFGRSTRRGCGMPLDALRFYFSTRCST